MFELLSIQELRKRSKTIAWHQGHLADLGAVVEKRRFAQITDLKEAKLIMGIIFDMVTREKHTQVKSLEARVALQESTIDSLKKQVAALTDASDANNTSITAPSKTAAQKQTTANPVKVRLPLHAPKSGFEGILREVKSTKPLTNIVNAASKKDSDGKSKRRDSDDEEDEYVDEMDESFYPSEQESDGEEDSDYDGSSRRNKRKGTAGRGKRSETAASRSKKSRSSDSEGSSANDSFGSGTSGSASELDVPMKVIPVDRPISK